MLTENDLTVLCSQLNLSHQARAIVSLIQSSPPSRRVGSGGKNVPVLYTSRKMGVTIQAESYKNELAGVYEMEHDPTVLAFYDQPPPIKLQYHSYYMQTYTPAVQPQAREEVIARVSSHPGITLHALLQQRDRAMSDDIYTLLALSQIYVDIYAAPLAEPERVHVFCDEVSSRAWAIAICADEFSDRSRPHTLLVEPGAVV